MSYPDSGLATRHRIIGPMAQINSDNEGNAIGISVFVHFISLFFLEIRSKLSGHSTAVMFNYIPITLDSILYECAQ